MSVKGFVGLLGLAMVVAGVVFGLVPHSTVVTGYPGTVACGMAFQGDTKASYAENTQATMKELGGGDPDYVAGSIISECRSARMAWLPWTLIAVGGVLVVGAIAIRTKPKVEPTPKA